MIRNKLAELLAERNIKISRVAAEIPDLSRNTITKVASNSGKMLQMETINSLCQYLKVSPADFFEYLPFDINFEVEISSAVFFDSAYGPALKDLQFDLFIKKHSIGSISKIFEYTGRLSKEDLNHDYPYWYANERLPVKLDPADHSNFTDFWQHKITPGFRVMLWQQLHNEIIFSIIQAAKDFYMHNQKANQTNVEEFFINGPFLTVVADFDSDMLPM